MASRAPPASMMRKVASIISGPMPSPRAIVIGVFSGIASFTFRDVQPTAWPRRAVPRPAGDLGAKLKPTRLGRRISAPSVLADVGRHHPRAAVRRWIENGNHRIENGNHLVTEAGAPLAYRVGHRAPLRRAPRRARR